MFIFAYYEAVSKRANWTIDYSVTARDPPLAAGELADNTTPASATSTPPAVHLSCLPDRIRINNGPAWMISYNEDRRINSHQLYTRLDPNSLTPLANHFNNRGQWDLSPGAVSREYRGVLFSREREARTVCQ